MICSDLRCSGRPLQSCRKAYLVVYHCLSGVYNYGSTAIRRPFNGRSTVIRLRYDHRLTCAWAAALRPKSALTYEAESVTDSVVVCYRYIRLPYVLPHI